MKKILPFIVGAALLIGIFLRVWQINKVPIALFGDEIDVGLQANSILTTGKDYLGNQLPILFHSFAEYRLPMQLYLDVPFINFFGLNEIGVRGPAVFMGFLSILAFYLLIKKLFDKKVALISALFMTFSPWHFNFSRQANDAGILLPFILFGAYFFIKGTKNFKYLLLATISFSLAIYTYYIATLFVPIFVLGLLVFYRKAIFAHGIKRLTLVAFLTLIILSPYIYKTFLGTTRERFSAITIVSTRGIEEEVSFARSLGGNFWGRLFNNKFTVVSSRLFDNYTQAFSPNFLFYEGDPNPRQSISEFGQMYHYDLILILIGLAIFVLSLKSAEKRKYRLFVFWLLIAPLASILTKGGGTHASRLILMLPPLILFSALGFNYLISLKKKPAARVLITLLFLLMLFDVTRFMNRYFVVWPQESWRLWQYGFKEVGTYLRANGDKYERVFLNNTYEPILPRFLFWSGYDMKLFQKQFTGDVHIKSIYPGFNGFKLGDKFFFGELVKPIENLAKDGNLVVASTEKDVTNPYIFDNPELKLQDIIFAPDQTTIFYIFTKK